MNRLKKMVTGAVAGALAAAMTLTSLYGTGKCYKLH